MVSPLVQRISEKGKIPAEEVLKKVEEKIEEFSGMISEEGALHLIARELKVEIEKADFETLKISELLPGMTQVKVTAKAMNILPIRTFSRKDGAEGKVANIVIGDETGTTRLVLWDEQTELTEKVSEGDVIEVKNAITRQNQNGTVELGLQTKSTVSLADEVEIDVVVPTKMTALIGSIGQEGAWNIKGTVLQLIRETTYTACPECRKKVTDKEKSECLTHGKVDAVEVPIVSLLIDDGSGAIRVVLFREQAKKIQEMKKREELLGAELLLSGRSKMNDFSNSWELIAQSVDSLDPKTKIIQVIENG